MGDLGVPDRADDLVAHAVYRTTMKAGIGVEVRSPWANRGR